MRRPFPATTLATRAAPRCRASFNPQRAVILRYRSPHNPALTLYDRYVSDGRYCQSSEVATRTGVPTADSNYCPLRKCIENDIFDFR